MKFRFLILALAASLALHAADLPPIFNATLTVGSENRFVLISAAGKSSEFLKLGQTFDGYTLKAYDAKAGALDLETGGKLVRVTLVGDAAVGNAPAAPTPATMADAQEVFRVMRFDEMMKKIMDGQKKAMLPMIQQQMGQAMARIGPNMSDEDKAALTAMQGKMMDQTLGVITSPEMRDAMAKIYSEVFSKEELNSLAGFYSTPGGQALVDKQPEVQQKMMGVMMPLIMKNQQGMQKEMAQFMTGLRAKYSPAGGATAPAGVPASAPAPKP